MKKNSSGHFLSHASVSVKKAAAICIAVYSLLLLFFLSGGQEFAYDRIVHPLVFQLRNRTSFVNPLDPRIRIYAVDQKTMNTIDHETVQLQDWTALMNSISKSKPAAVFIDKGFLLNLTTDEKKIADFKLALAKLPKVIAGATVSAVQIQGLTEMQSDRLLNLSSAWPSSTPGFIYGPRAEITGAFTHVGHTNYEDYGYVKPIIRTQSGSAIPMWSLFVRDLSFHDDGVNAGGNKVPVDAKDKVLVNLSRPADYWKKTYSLINVLKKARAGEVIADINSETVVVILAGMHAGATSMKNTPAGTMPGGFILIEVINSVLSNKWIRYSGFELFHLAVFCLLGWGAAIYLNTRNFWLTLLLSEIAIVAVGIIAFVVYGRLLPWAFPAAGYFLTGIAIFAERSRVSEAKAKALQFSLEGMIEPQRLEQIMRHPEKFRLEPRNQVLTVMFIDIVGFSTMAERESPAAVFARLRELLGLASDLVHKSGGVIDRSLGDGLLCFFGYQFDANAPIAIDHAQEAIKCAATIQHEILKRDTQALENGGVMFPLRIGINTGEVYVGDLGSGHKIDFTIIGHSVNFAQRLESACENYRVMCGPSTADRISSAYGQQQGYSRKLIAIKHHTELVEAFEFDPFFQDAEKQQQRKLLCRKLDQASRIDERWPVPADIQIKVEGEFGKGVVTNFSISGLEVDSDTYIGKGAIINFIFSTPTGNLETELKSAGISQISAEVRWSWKEGDTHRLGLLFKNQSSETKETIFNCIRKMSITNAG